MAWGTGSFGSTPLGIPATLLPAEDPARVSTSRKVDPLTKRFVQTTNGGYAGMTDACQRVLLLTLQALANHTGLITPDEQGDTEQRVRAALSVMADGKEPVIELRQVLVTDDGRDAEQVTIEFLDLGTGKVETVRPRGAT
jgi:hypothetical protein